MYKHSRTSKEMVSMKNQNKVSCSTPEHRADSPSRDSDSMCDSDAGSPVPFLCTQDGVEGVTEVIWNYNTPKTDHAIKSRFQNSTPISRRSKHIKNIKSKLIEKQLPKRRARRAVKLPHETEFFQGLSELNELTAKKPQESCTEKVNSGSEDDIFNASPENSPKSRLRSNSICLRRNVLSSNFVKNDPDAALESDDSMNECLIKASQIVEEKIKTESSSKVPCKSIGNRTLKPDFNFKIDQDSMDAILNSIKLDSPAVNNLRKHDSPKLNNDTFDSLVGNLNDSTFDNITQGPVRMDFSNIEKNQMIVKDGSDWLTKEFVPDNSPSTKSIFGRHSSMPESPTIVNADRPSTSKMVFGRYSSMPFGKDPAVLTEPGDSPIRCTPDEIKKKHQLAREKLMAKRLLPFTSTQKPTQTLQSTQALQKTQQFSTTKPKYELSSIPKKEEAPAPKKFQPRVPSTVVQNKPIDNTQPQSSAKNCDSLDMKTIIEKKRQEALMKLRRRQVQRKL